MTQKHILVTDDEEIILRAIMFSLELEGYNISTAGNGIEALAVIEKFTDTPTPIQLMITDIQMPKMTGIELIDEMQKRELNIPILVMTGFGTKEMVIQLLQKGVKDYLDKPFVPEKLLSRVERIFKKYVDNKSQRTIAPQENKPETFAIKHEDQQSQLTVTDKYNSTMQEQLRSALLAIFDKNNPAICIDLIQQHEVDITFLNALVAFAQMHQEKHPQGTRQIINIHIDIMTLFNAVDLSSLYSMESNKEINQ